VLPALMACVWTLCQDDIGVCIGSWWSVDPDETKATYVRTGSCDTVLASFSQDMIVVTYETQRSW